MIGAVVRGEGPLDPSPHLAQLGRVGAIRFRGFDVPDLDAFATVVRAAGAPLPYDFGSSPRTAAGAGVYTSTDYPPAETIPQHHEMSYTADWPRLLWMWCAVPATHGGETPLADGSSVYARLPASLRRRWEAKGIRYVRNFTGDLDLPWQRAFETDDRAELERRIAARGLRAEWRGREHLRTSEIRPATLEHPVHGPVWFNQAHLFHPSSLPEEVREAMLDLFAPDDLPRTATFGDGTPLPEDDLAEVRLAFDAETVSEPWTEAEVVVVDNTWVTHGRRPFRGPRRVYVAMTHGERS
ncbi:MAG: TauD/TfdA family dioxygenase [Myxococcota bacterium]